MAENAAKRVKLDGPLIGTHNGHFHADEALAVYLLRLLPTYRASPLVRTRDAAKLADCHTVVDVGGEYDASRHRYDHHQRTFTTTFPEHATKLSSAGLVWMHFGRDIVAHRTGLAGGSEELELVHRKLYDDFVEAVDANDNGISVYDAASVPGGQLPEKRFKDHGVTLASLVSDLNYDFDPEEDGDASGAATAKAGQGEQGPGEAQRAEDERFLRASKLMGSSFLRKLHHAASDWLPARAKVADAYAGRKGVDASGRIVVLPVGGIPWKEHLYNMEQEAAAQKGLAEVPEEDKAYYVLYPENETEGSKWRVQAVSVSGSSFENRKGLKEDWRGVRDEELSAKAGIPGCVFVHASGFIGGNATKEGALEMARRSLAA